MNKTIKSIMVACLIFTGFTINAQKLGHVNSQEIMLELPDYEDARKELESYQSDIMKELEMFQKLIEEFYQDYQQNMEGMSAETRQRKEADLMERQQNLEKKKYEAQTKLQEKEQQLLQQIMVKVNNAVKELAEKEGYTYVYEEATLLYAGGEDISNKVREKLGIAVKQD